MTVAGFDIRLKALGVLMGVVLIALIGRLWLLQITRWSDYCTSDGELRVGYRKLALFNRTAAIRTPAPRGTIYDRQGNMLAETRAVWSACITPADLPDDLAQREELIVRLASIFRGSATSAEIREAIGGICAQGSVDPLPLGSFAEDIPLEIVADIEEHRSELPGVSVIEHFRRHYPYGKLAAHVLGYARGITDEQYEEVKELECPAPPGESGDDTEAVRADRVYARDSEFGQTGIEWALELNRSNGPPTPILQGRHGILEYQVDVRNRPLRVIRERLPERGASVYLTLDLELQKLAEEALHQTVEHYGTTGVVVLMDVRTGEVLVMCSRPSVDANRWAAGFTDEAYETLANDPRKPFYNKAISGEYPPGSAFKIISAVAALQTTSVRPSHTFVCGGIIHEGTDHQPFRCWVYPDRHRRLDFLWAIAKSCDVYFYELVRKGGLTSEAIAKYARAFGLGESTNCGLPAEVDGLVPDRTWKLDEKGEGWWTGDTLQFVIGQSFLTVTPLQMTVATAAIANGGKVLKPQLVRKIVWPAHVRRGPTIYKAQVTREVKAAPESLKMVRDGMRLAVTAEKGTAHNLADPNLPLAGKTGSAQSYLDRQTHAWFVCYAPDDHPRFACAVLVTEAGYGSTAAAPIAAKVMGAALRKYGG